MCTDYTIISYKKQSIAILPHQKRQYYLPTIYSYNVINSFTSISLFTLALNQSTSSFVPTTNP